MGRKKSNFTCSDYDYTTNRRLWISQNIFFAKCVSSCTGIFCCSAVFGLCLWGFEGNPGTEPGPRTRQNFAKVAMRSTGRAANPELCQISFETNPSTHNRREWESSAPRVAKKRLHES